MRNTLLFVTMMAGAMGMTHCSGDDSTPSEDAAVADSGTDGKATGAGGKTGAGGASAADSGKVDGSAGGSTDGSVGGNSGTGGFDDGAVGTGGADDGSTGAGGGDAAGTGGAAVGSGGAAVGTGGTAVGAGGTAVGAGGADAGRDGATVDARSDADAAAQCPASQEIVDGQDCPSKGLTCQGTVQTDCHCRYTDQKWWCVDNAYLSDASCPTKVPTKGEACLATLTGCPYAISATQLRSCTCPAPSTTSGGVKYQRWDCTDIDLTDAGEDAGDAAQTQDAADATPTPDAAETPDAADASEDVDLDAADAEVDGEQ